MCIRDRYVFILLYFYLLLLRRRQSKEYQPKYQFIIGLKAVYESCRSEIRAPKMSIVRGMRKAIQADAPLSACVFCLACLTHMCASNVSFSRQPQCAWLSPDRQVLGQAETTPIAPFLCSSSLTAPHAVAQTTADPGNWEGLRTSACVRRCIRFSFSSLSSSVMLILPRFLNCNSIDLDVGMFVQNLRSIRCLGAE